jgi:hypothetical protein
MFGIILIVRVASIGCSSDAIMEWESAYSFDKLSEAKDVAPDFG